MSSLLAQISSFLPIFLASPTMYAGMILIMSSPTHTRLRVFAALIGSVAAIAAIGVVALAVGGTTGTMGKSTFSGIVDLILGSALLLLTLWVLLRRKPRHKAEKKARRPEDAAAGPGFLKYAFYGIVLVVTNPTSLASYFASAKLTLDSGLPGGQQSMAMLLAGFYFTLPVLIPMILLLIAPGLCRKFLDLAQRVLAKYGRYIVVLFLIYVGINLISKGIGILS